MLFRSWRAGSDSRDCLDSISMFSHTELVFHSSLPQDQCYDIKCCHNVIQCKWMEYCAHCFQCEHCFGCAGLVGKKYHILNLPYSAQEYASIKAGIIAKMKKEGVYGRFFPATFAANPYEESISGFYWPLPMDEGQRLGFRMKGKEVEEVKDASDAREVPDRADEADPTISNRVFWDSEMKRPFQILPADIAFAEEVGAPLPYSYYMNRLQKNFRHIPFNGSLRRASCGRCRTAINTSWPKKFDSRVLCEECYLKEVY